MSIQTKKTMHFLIITFLLMTAASAGTAIFLVILKNLFFAFFWYHILFCIVIPFIDLIIIQKKSIRESMTLLGGRIFTIKTSVILSIITGFVFIIASFGVYFLARDTISVELFSGFPFLLVISGAAFLVLFNGFLEEFFWRGYIYNRLCIIKYRPLALLINAVFFTSYHVPLILVFSPDSLIAVSVIALIFAAGIFFNYFRERSGSLIPSIILHIMVGAGYTAAFLFLFFFHIAPSL